MINVAAENNEMSPMISKPLSKLTLESSSIGASLIVISKALSTLIAYAFLTHFLPQDQVGMFLALISFILLAYNMSRLGLDGAYTRFATVFLLQRKYQDFKLITSLYWKYVIFVSIPGSMVILWILGLLCGITIPPEIMFFAMVF